MNDLPESNAALDKDERIFALALRYLDGVATTDEEMTLLADLRSDAESRLNFVTLCRQAGMLHETFSTDRAECPTGRAEEELGAAGPADLSVPPNISINPVRYSGSPAFQSSGLPWGTIIFSYAVSALFLCVALLWSWFHTITHDQDATFAADSRGLTAPGESSPDRPAPVFVGRVTGIAGAKWSDDPDYIAPIGVRVALGRTYKLKSGLMEITYDSGAKVILEGPCDYNVDSTAGGYLALGKLTAKVASGEWRVASGTANPEIPKSRNPEIPSPQPATPSPLFSVRTPTAVVTDLGTEFGVAVDESGDTTSHVYCGSVRVQMIGSRKEETVLNENESAIVPKDADSLRLIVGDGTAVPLEFVRRIPAKPAFIDLLDVVAGGNGWSRRREKGIDASTGEVDFKFAEKRRHGDGRYVDVVWSKLIDGVFIPDGGAGPVQLDSAGHSFGGFPATSNLTYGSLFARAAEIAPDKTEDEMKHWVYRIGRCREFMPQDRGLLTFCPNVGITFDLEALRSHNSGFRPSRLLATIGMGDVRPYYPEAGNLADFWVFVDGRPTWKQLKLSPNDGAISVDIKIGPDDRFLTLVSTNSEGSRSCDWVVVGDPVLQMIQSETSDK